jgi:hypothetical protein
MPSKYEMLKRLIPEAYINPRHEGFFSPRPLPGEKIYETTDDPDNWTKDDVDLVDKDRAEQGVSLNASMVKLEELSKKDPKYLEDIINRATGTNFDIGKTYQVLSKENPSREEMVSAVKDAWQRGDKDRQPWWWDYEEYGEFPAGLTKMSDEDLKYKIRNYAPLSIIRAADIYDQELDRKDMEDLMEGRRKPRNLDELRKLAKGATGSSWDPDEYTRMTPKGRLDKQKWDFDYKE